MLFFGISIRSACAHLVKVTSLLPTKEYVQEVWEADEVVAAAPSPSAASQVILSNSRQFTEFSEI